MGGMEHERHLRPWGFDQVFIQWQLETVLLVPCLLLAAAYLFGTQLARRRASWPWWRTASFLAGLGVAVLATHSGIGVYAGTLFSVHMVQHLALIMVAPTFLAAGRPLTLIGAAGGLRTTERVRAVLRQPVLAALTSPLAAIGAYAAVLVGTHLTGLMGTIMTHPAVGEAEQWLYLMVGWWFFSHVFGDEPVRWRLSMPGRLLMLAVSMAVDTFVGVSLMQNSSPVSMLAHPGWGPSPLTDTQTGGALMWWAGDGIMALQVLLLFFVWAQQPESVRRGADSFYERVRRSTFAEQTGFRAPIGAWADGTGPADAPDFDDDEARHDAYNAWLARLNAQDH